MNISQLAQDFEFVDTIKIDRNVEGKIDLKQPQPHYDRSDEIPVHRYGWGPFCKFTVDTSEYQGSEGVYIFTANHHIVYIGEAKDIHSRIRSGYSNISPRNCFQGGQQTNCRINTAILEVVRNRGKVALWAKKTRNRKQLESELIEEYAPEWNLTSPSGITPSEQEYSGITDMDSHQDSTGDESPPVQNKSNPGKYQPLYDYLQKADSNSLRLSFREIEEILEAPLPKSAGKYEVWWNPAGHSHAEGWAELGWSAHPDLDNEKVRFEKNL